MPKKPTNPSSEASSTYTMAKIVAHCEACGQLQAISSKEIGTRAPLTCVSCGATTNALVMELPS